MKQLIKQNVTRISEYIYNQLKRQSIDDPSFLNNISFGIASETLLNHTTIGKKPNEIFYGISDDFWFWLHTEGLKKNAALKRILPGFPNDETQTMFTGAAGEQTLREAYHYYKIFRDQYQKYRGDISEARMLDFGCGWGRIIRFFLKDIEPSRIWGCDPVPEMIKLCKEQNKWCNFEQVNTNPPGVFEDNSFDMIYSYSVFSHLSEDFHLTLLPEIKRILKPGGLYLTTTRNRDFINYCAELRKNTDLDSSHPGKGSSHAFLDTKKSLSDFDNGLFCHHSFNDPNWPYWGETAIPKSYVMNNWTKHFTFVDFLEENPQNVIIVQKPPTT